MAIQTIGWRPGDATEVQWAAAALGVADGSHVYTPMPAMTEDGVLSGIRVYLRFADAVGQEIKPFIADNAGNFLYVSPTGVNVVGDPAELFIDLSSEAISLTNGSTYYVGAILESAASGFRIISITGSQWYTDTGTWPTANASLSFTNPDDAFTDTALIASLDYDDTPVTPEIRKGSTFDIETTLGTITTATLNSVNVFDHVTGQTGTTVSFAGAATDEITTSGEYTLTLGDGTGTEDITVQVNVYGVAPSNNPLQKDGAALASLTGVQARITNGANINGTELYYSGAATTDVSGNLGNIDLSSTAAADTNPVLLHLRTAAGDSIIASETVGLI